eukprot:scaffold25360_cov122-Isochrysis_galbana.AAC.5
MAESIKHGSTFFFVARSAGVECILAGWMGMNRNGERGCGLWRGASVVLLVSPLPHDVHDVAYGGSWGGVTGEVLGVRPMNE